MSDLGSPYSAVGKWSLLAGIRLNSDAHLHSSVSNRYIRASRIVRCCYRRRKPERKSDSRI